MNVKEIVSCALSFCGMVNSNVCFSQEVVPVHRRNVGSVRNISKKVGRSLKNSRRLDLKREGSKSLASLKSSDSNRDKISRDVGFDRVLSVISSVSLPAEVLAGYSVFFLAQKISDTCINEREVFEKLKKFKIDVDWGDKCAKPDIRIGSGYEEDDNLSSLVHLVGELSKLNNFYISRSGDVVNVKGGGNYSYVRTPFRSIVDLLSLRTAVSRECRSAGRILSSPIGSCWECSQIVDLFCRNMGCANHHIIVYAIMPGIYHTFNFFVYNGRFYLCEPIDGRLYEIKGEDSLRQRIHEFYIEGTHKGNASFRTPGDGWYVVDQINKDDWTLLATKRLARFLPKDKEDNDAFLKFEGDEKVDVKVVKFVNGGKTLEDRNLNELTLNDNPKFNVHSSLLYG